MDVAEHVEDGGGGVDHVGAQRVAGGARAGGGGGQRGGAAARVAAVVGDPGQQPVGVGAAAPVGAVLEQLQRVLGLALGGVERAGQPVRLGADQLEAGLLGETLRLGQRGQQRRRLGRPAPARDRAGGCARRAGPAVSAARRPRTRAAPHSTAPTLHRAQTFPLN
ncbi:MAG: hypothetical protein V4462_09490 [Pseudomonadota bacterium]